MKRKIILTEADKAIEESDPNFSLHPKHKATLLNAINTSGVFISAGKTTPNIMSSHWGSLGVFWNRDVFVLPIRKNKLTHEIIDVTKSFAISVPIKDMRNQIVLCDHLSGYGTNKFEKLHLHPARARKIPTYTVSECGLFFECRVIFWADDMSPGQVDPTLMNEMYLGKEFHTFYFGQIIDAYEKP